ncbi:MAG: LamB/YcsF family protein [Ignavibacteriales bacterium]|nr:LamB/YcsF family protein [Ignavibacteriales bacterium]
MSPESNCIDINADVGERTEALLDGSEERLLRVVTSANIACGGHAGNSDSMRSVVRLCQSLGVSIGAHPGYPDRQGFGRSRLNMPLSEIEVSLVEQISSLLEIASLCGANVHHVKPHGALYNAAASDNDLAATIARATAIVDRNLMLVGLAGSLMLDVWRDFGFSVIAEAFADRRYEADGTLRSRGLPGALIVDPLEAAAQVLLMVKERAVESFNGSTVQLSAQTICIHGDTSNAALIAGAVRRALERSGVVLRSF